MLFTWYIRYEISLSRVHYFVPLAAAGTGAPLAVDCAGVTFVVVGTLDDSGAVGVDAAAKVVDGVDAGAAAGPGVDFV